MESFILRIFFRTSPDLGLADNEFQSTKYIIIMRTYYQLLRYTALDLDNYYRQRCEIVCKIERPAKKKILRRTVNGFPLHCDNNFVD